MVISLCKWVCAGILLFSGAIRQPERKDFHPFYASVTEVKFNAPEQLVEISCKIFADDLEAALKKANNIHVDLSDEKMKAPADKMILDYISGHLRFRIDGKEPAFEYVGREKENDAVWIYFQIQHVAAIKKMEITNSILYEMFDSEVNIMHAMVGNNRQSAKLNAPDTKVDFEF